jgi:hypothetical protein
MTLVKVMSLSPAQLLVTIAERLGWTRIELMEKGSGANRAQAVTGTRDGGDLRFVPSWDTDLNAIHAVLVDLAPQMQYDYGCYLTEVLEAETGSYPDQCALIIANPLACCRALAMALSVETEDVSAKRQHAHC